MNIGQKIKIRQRNKEYFEVLYEKIRLIDKDIFEFTEKLSNLKKEENPKLLSFKRFKRLFKTQKLNPLINTYRRDIWNLENKRKELMDSYKDRSVEDPDVIILDVSDIMDYVSLLDNDNNDSKHTSKIISIISKLKISSNNLQYNLLNDRKQYLLKKYKIGGEKEDESSISGLCMF